MAAEAGAPTWSYASLTLRQPGWPGTAGAQWVAATAAGELFRTPDVLEALDRLGVDGWEVVAFAPEVGDRPTCFFLKTPRREPSS
jgi:hypothetical protein